MSNSSVIDTSKLDIKEKNTSDDIPVKPYKDLQELDERRNISYKKASFLATSATLLGLYVLSVAVIVYIVFFLGNTKENWMLLPFSLGLLVLPVAIHITVLNKLYKNKDDNTNHPVIDAILKLIQVLSNKSS